MTLSAYSAPWLACSNRLHQMTTLANSLVGNLLLYAWVLACRPVGNAAHRPTGGSRC
jgi:hypothetical protein